MNPIVNLDELDEFKQRSKGSYSEKRCAISEKLGAKKLSYSVVVVPSGHKVCPFHNHRINEELFLILEGEGTLRFGEREYPVRKNDLICCPPGGHDVAHQIINTGSGDIKYFCLSTNEPYEICEYPDSNKILSAVGNASRRDFVHISRKEDEVDYFLGEE